MNSIRIIAPYKHEGFWVFDDERAGLVKEPFVSGTDTLIDKATSGIQNAEKGFALLFSDQPFPGMHIELEWRRSEMNGNWYYSEKFDQEGWLCPALFKYFEKAPARIFVQVKEKF